LDECSFGLWAVYNTHKAFKKGEIVRPVSNKVAAAPPTQRMA